MDPQLSAAGHSGPIGFLVIPAIVGAVLWLSLLMAHLAN